MTYIIPTMNTLKEYLQAFDTSDLDYKDPLEIEADLKVFYNSGLDPEEENESRQAKREIEIFRLVKSIRRGLIPVMSESGLNDKGEEVLNQWPDIRPYTDTDFEYISGRYTTTQNPFGKHQYGMLLFLAGKRKDNPFVLELLDVMLLLCERYNKKALYDEEKKTRYTGHLIHTLYDAFSLACSRKSDRLISTKLDVVKSLIFSTIINWNVRVPGTEWAVCELTGLVKDNIQEFKVSFDLDLILEKNWEVANVVRKESEHSAISVAQGADKLAERLKKDRIRWNRLIAECYESVARKRGGIVAPDFYIKSMRHYKIIGDNNKLSELNREFSKAKKQLNLSPMSYTLPEEAAEEVMNNISDIVNHHNAESIIAELTVGRMILPFTKFKKNRDEDSNTVMFKYFNVGIYDKHGNKNVVLDPENEEDYSSYFNLYSLYFQIPSKIYLKLFIEAVKAGKLSSNDLLEWLEKHTWLGQEVIKLYQGYSKAIVPLDVIRPGIVLMFSEFEKGLSLKDYNADFILALDSLSLKVEYLLRLICEEKLGISSTYIKEDGTTEEKTFGHLISDMKKVIKDCAQTTIVEGSSTLDDLIYIEFVMNHKAGINIRNRVAHGLLDKDEYSPLKMVLVLSVLLKISSFDFLPNK